MDGVRRREVGRGGEAGGLGKWSTPGEGSPALGEQEEAPARRSVV